MLGHFLLGKARAASEKRPQCKHRLGPNQTRINIHRVEIITGTHTVVPLPLGVTHSYFQFLGCVFLWSPIPVPQYPFKAFPWKPVSPLDPNEASNTMSCRVVKPVLSSSCLSSLLSLFFFHLEVLVRGLTYPLPAGRGPQNPIGAWLPGLRGPKLQPL